MNQGWGVGSGDKAWDDERAGVDIAKNDENEAQTPAGEEPKEPVDTSKSFADYMAEKAAAGDLSAKPVRTANEGSKADQKWANAKELKRDEDDTEYIKGKEEKSKAPKQRKEKAYVDVDLRFVEPARGGNGGRGAPRGGRGRGGGGGGGATRGAVRGGRGNGPRGTSGPTVDEKNFPSLGA